MQTARRQNCACCTPSELYVLSEAKTEKVAVLRRTARPFPSLDVVRSENERLVVARARIWLVARR
jgi:hypothetical protein